MRCLKMICAAGGAALLLALLLTPVSGCAATGPAGLRDVASEGWTLVYERDMSDARVFSEWTPVLGSWSLGRDAMEKGGPEGDGLLMLRQPVVAGAVRVRYEVRAQEPGDVSLFLGMSAGEFDGAAFAGVGSSGNTAHRLRVPGRRPLAVQDGLLTPGRWHTVTVERAGGVVRVVLDGQEILSGPDAAQGYAGPYLGLYAWNLAQFRRVAVWSREDEALASFLPRSVRDREMRLRHQPPFSLWDFTRTVDQSIRSARSGIDSGLARLDVRTTEVGRTSGALGCSAASAPGGATGLLYWGAGDGGRVWLRLMVQEASGTWVMAPELPDAPVREGECGLTATSDGGWVATWSSLPGADDTGHWLTRWSDADGWSAWESVGVGAAHGPLAASDGRWLYLGRAEEDGTAHVRLIASSDEGRTWQRVWTRPVSPVREVQLHGASLAELGDGRLVAMLSYNREGWDAHLWQMESYDGGSTWSTPWVTEMYGTQPHLLRLDSGLLLCSYNHPRPPLGRRVSVSEDDGRSWSVRRELILTANAVDTTPGSPCSVAVHDGDHVRVFYTQTGQTAEDLLFRPYRRTASRVVEQRWPLPSWFRYRATPSIIRAADALRDVREVEEREPFRSMDELRSARREAARRRRRIIMNNDGDDSVHAPVEEFLRQRTSGLIGSQVDSIFYCTGINNLYSHPNTETEIFRPGHQALFEHGTDALREMVRFTRRHDLELFWSLRMNDNHDSYNPVLWSHWKTTRPDLLMSTLERGPSIWATLDYSRSEVRDKAVATIADVVHRYDVDGIELDFFRDPLFFAEGFERASVTEDHVALMTDMIRRIRAVTEAEGMRRGRALLVAARLPDCPAVARSIGLDTERWLEEDLLDLVVGGGLFMVDTTMQTLYDLGQRHDVPVYVSLGNHRLGERRNNMELWRGEALKAWEAGLDGIYTFNVFDPDDEFFRQLGDPEILRTLPHRFDSVKGMQGWVDY